MRLKPTADNGLTKLSVPDTFQVCSVSQQRLIRQLGTLSDTAMQEIYTALTIVLNIDTK